MSIIIQATASRIRPTARSASARSLLHSTYCSRVTFDNVRKTRASPRSRFPLAALLAVASTTNSLMVNSRVHRLLHTRSGLPCGNSQRVSHSAKRCPPWVKTGKARCEHMFSALPPKADVPACSPCGLSCGRPTTALAHATRHEAVDDHFAVEPQRPDHRSARPVRFGDQGVSGNIDPVIPQGELDSGRPSIPNQHR